MKNIKLILAVAAVSAVSIPGVANAGYYENYFGGQEGVNRHLQGSVNDDRKRISGLERGARNQHARIEYNTKGRKENAQAIADGQAYDKVQDGRIADGQAYTIEQFQNERHDRQAADDRLKAGISGALAAAAVQFDPSYDGLQVSVAGGWYEGESAANLSVGGAVSDRVFLAAGVSHDSAGNQGYNASANFKF